MKKPRDSYTVGLYRPEGVTPGEMQQYILDAVTEWAGQAQDDDPFCGAGLTMQVEVRRKRHRKP